jgi:hypothetical protein
MGMWIQHLHTEKFTEHRKRTNKMEGERGRGSGRRVRGDIEREREEEGQRIYVKRENTYPYLNWGF